MDQEATPQVETPEVAPKPSLSGDYELGDVGYDAVADATPEIQEPVAIQQQEAAPPPAAPPKHSSRLVRMATELGLSQDDIAGASPEHLEDLVYHVTRERLNHIRREEPRVPEEKPKSQEEDLGIDETQYDEGLVKAIKTVRDKYKKEIDELKEAVGSFKKTEEVRTAESFNREVDHWFEKTNDSRFGKGKLYEISRDSDEHARRMALVAQAMKYKDGDLHGNLDRAHKLLFGDKPKPEPVKPDPGISPADLKQKQEDWNAAAVARPTQRNGAPEPKGDKRAMAAAHRFMRESGMLAPEDESKDGFLD